MLKIWLYPQTKNTNFNFSEFFNQYKYIFVIYMSRSSDLELTKYSFHAYFTQLLWPVVDIWISTVWVQFQAILPRKLTMTETKRFEEPIETLIQYFARNWPWYSLRDLHIRITWFSLYGIRIPLLSLYGIHMPLLPYMVIQPIVLGMSLLWAAMDSSLSQGPLLWRHNDMTVIVSRNTRGRERNTQQRLDNANARRLQTVNR